MDFYHFWTLYAPLPEFRNRYKACERLWDSMNPRTKTLIVDELEQHAERSPPEQHGKNPYFFLLDWQPPKPQWLTPNETARLLAQHIPLAVALDTQTNSYKVCTKEQAQKLALMVHHYM